MAGDRQGFKVCLKAAVLSWLLTKLRRARVDVQKVLSLEGIPTKHSQPVATKDSHIVCLHLVAVTTPLQNV